MGGFCIKNNSKALPCTRWKSILRKKKNESNYRRFPQSSNLVNQFNEHFNKCFVVLDWFFFRSSSNYCKKEDIRSSSPAFCTFIGPGLLSDMMETFSLARRIGFVGLAMIYGEMRKILLASHILMDKFLLEL